MRQFMQRYRFWLNHLHSISRALPELPENQTDCKMN
jgi:hypothetical protein